MPAGEVFILNDDPLLVKVRQVNRILPELDKQPLDLNTGARLLGEAAGAAVIIAGPQGRIQGRYEGAREPCALFLDHVSSAPCYPGYLHPDVSLTNREVVFNLQYTGATCVLEGNEGKPCLHAPIFHTLVPIISADEFLGSLILRCCDQGLPVEGLILAEIGAALLGLSIARSRAVRDQEAVRLRSLVNAAFDSLSYSEIEAIEEIFRALDGQESVIVASRIADELGITRSVIVNALRKFESAGIIESRSLGMKGTFIRVKSPALLQEITNLSPKLKHQADFRPFS